MKDPHKVDYYRFKNISSIGPNHSCRDLALVVCYVPFLHRKVARFFNKLRRIYRYDFSGEGVRRATVYARQAMKDTKLPYDVKLMVWNAVYAEFGISPDYSKKS